MSEKKMFTASEVARMILEKAHNTLKKHEEMLQKSKNSAHEIDAGEEPKNDEAECPDSLKGEGSSGASKSESKKENSPAAESEDSEMEDEPLSDSDSEEDESEEEDEYEFKKSESGMHTVQYKTLAKKEQPLKKLMSATSNMPGSVATTGKPSIGAQIGFPGMGKEENQPKSDSAERISTKRFESGEKKMSREGHGEVKRTAMNPSETSKQFQDPRKKMGMWRSKKAKETGNDSYLMGHKDKEYKEE